MYYARSNSPIICALLILQLKCLVVSVDSYVLREPRFEILQPQGLRVTIPDETGLQFFAFHGNVNKGITPSQSGEISGEVYRARDGKWTVEDNKINLRDGDVIHYWIYAQANGLTHRNDNQRWTVALEPQRMQATSTERPNQVNPSPPSDGVLLFEDNFNSINTSIWARDIKMPLAPDYEFCVYHNQNHEFLVTSEDGILRVRPLVLEDYYGENATAYGTIQLGGCTSNLPAECSRHAVSYNILPPIISARLSTKQSFSFRYGKVEIRAKFPEGDWLYPEMWLEPKYHSYGLGYSSGRVLLGLSRGNENLVTTTDQSTFDSRRLDFGVRVGVSMDIDEYLVSKITESGPRWTQDFHVYTTIWDANGFQYLVDGQEVGRLSPGPNGWMKGNSISAGRKTAPFDQDFHIVLGLGVGGVRVFPDGTISSGYPKPWKNVGAKAMLKFWNARNVWLPSWRREQGRKTLFEIDYVRVWTL